MPVSERAKPLSAPAVASAEEAVVYNLNGQKLGRKGRSTRDRILAAAGEVLECPDEAPISLSSVARKSSLGMTSLYNYFADLTELLLAMLEPVMATAESSYVDILREPWSDEDLADRCHCFVHEYYAFWARNSRLLHLRNTMSDSGDRRMMVHRVKAAQPVIRLLAAQMGWLPEDMDSSAMRTATVLLTGIERTVTVATDTLLTSLFGEAARFPPEHYLEPSVRLMELAIRDVRQAVAGR